MGPPSGRLSRIAADEQRPRSPLQEANARPGFPIAAVTACLWELRPPRGSPHHGFSVPRPVDFPAYRQNWLAHA